MRQPPTPAAAYYQQRHAIAAASPRLKAMRDALADPVNLSPAQWAQWYAYAREFRPDLVLELGRGTGNSTATMLQALHDNRHGRLVSLCLTQAWAARSVPLLRPLVPADWFDRLDARVGDLTKEDFAALVGDAQRVAVVWDAHGLVVAEAMLGRIMPLIASREHFVIMHDISDRRYCGSKVEYGERELWKGLEWVDANGRGDCRLYLGWIDTCVDQPIVTVDFLARNRTELQSADHSFHEELGKSPERLAEMRRVMPGEDLDLIGHWAWFTLNGVPGPYTFPHVPPPQRRPPVEPATPIPACTPVTAAAPADPAPAAGGSWVRRLLGRRGGS
jgi:hypothetical protein